MSKDAFAAFHEAILRRACDALGLDFHALRFDWIVPNLGWLDPVKAPESLEQLRARSEALGRKLDDFERRHPWSSPAAREARWEAGILADMAREERRHAFLEHWRAVGMLLTRARGDVEDWSSIPSLALRGHCLLAMLLGRGCGRRDLWGVRSVDMGWWNYSRHYGGWSCSTLTFWPSRLRYAIGSDGESEL